MKDTEAWNAWRKARPRIKPDLSGADLADEELIQVDLRLADLRQADLSGADLSGANLTEADLGGANLVEANLAGSILYKANLAGADLSGAFLRWADLSRADLTGADLSDADLRRTHLARTIFNDCQLTRAKVYGVSAWNISLSGAHQSDLIITEDGEPTITVDDLEIAQFVYLLLHNQSVRKIIDTVTSKVVLILGRFTAERKAVLDAIRVALREKDLVPIIFDFANPVSRNLTETVSTLAHLAQFIVADITDAKSVPQELQRIVPNLPSVPVQPILLDTAGQYGMFRDFFDFPWVLQPFLYSGIDQLLDSLDDRVIGPAQERASEIARRRFELETTLRNNGGGRSNA